MTALEGMVTCSVGAQVADDPPAAVTALNAVRDVDSDWARAAVSCPGTKVAVPEVEVAGPDQ